MIGWPTRLHWRAEGLRFSRHPASWIGLAALLCALLAAALVAGAQTRAWRLAEAQDAGMRAERLEAAVRQFSNGPAPGRSRAVATYQLGRGDLGATRIRTGSGLALGVHGLVGASAQEKVSLDSRAVVVRDPGPLRNSLLIDAGLPGLPAMVALMLPLVALMLCAGSLQEEREQGRLGLLRVQSRGGLWSPVVASLGWRWLALWAAAAAGTLPAIAMDPQAGFMVALQWCAALAGFCFFWVVVGGLLSAAPISGAACTLAATGVWLALTFGVPALLVEFARREAPTPSRLSSILEIRDIQSKGEDREQDLAATWYAAHPEVPAHLPATWPASLLPRTLEQDRALRSVTLGFRQARFDQAEIVQRWAWLSPGLALVMFGERLAGTDPQSVERYLSTVDAFEARWREHLVPRVMDLQGIDERGLLRLPNFDSNNVEHHP